MNDSRYRNLQSDVALLMAQVRGLEDDLADAEQQLNAVKARAKHVLGLIEQYLREEEDGREIA